MRRKIRRYRGGDDKPTISQIETATKNIKHINTLMSARKPLQAPGNIYRAVGSGRKRRHYGGAIRDRYGAYLYVPNV